MKKKHSVVLLVFAVVAIGAIVAMRAFAGNKGAAAPAGPAGGGGRGGPVAVETEAVSVRPMVDIREFSGTVKASYTYVISAKVGGRLLSINKR